MIYPNKVLVNNLKNVGGAGAEIFDIWDIIFIFAHLFLFLKPSTNNNTFDLAFEKSCPLAPKTYRKFIKRLLIK